MRDGLRVAASFADVANPAWGARGAFRLWVSITHIRSVCLIGAALAFAGCAGAPKPEAAFDPQLAKQVNNLASEAAVAKPGTKVCRWVQLGIAERDLIRGVVQQGGGSQVRIRIEDAGRFPKSLNGHQVGKGEVVSDAAVAWTPCVF